MMKKICSALFLIVLCMACGPAVKESKSTVSITPNLKYDTCITGYIRTLPNFCARTTITPTGFGTILDGTCRQQNIGAVIPTEAKYIVARVNFNILSGNLVALRNIQITFYEDSTCTTSFSFLTLFGREWIALPNGTTILQQDAQALLPVVPTAQIYYIGTQSGVTSSFFFSVIGYYD